MPAHITFSPLNKNFHDKTVLLLDNHQKERTAHETGKPKKCNTDRDGKVFFTSLQVMEAGIFGSGLAVPSNAKLQQMRNSAPPYAHSAPKPLDAPARPPAW